MVPGAQTIVGLGTKAGAVTLQDDAAAESGDSPAAGRECDQNLPIATGGGHRIGHKTGMMGALDRAALARLTRLSRQRGPPQVYGIVAPQGSWTVV